MTNPNIPAAQAEELPYGGDIRSLRVDLGVGAARAWQRFEELSRRLPDLTGQEMQEHRLAHNAAFYGVALAGVLGWLEREHGAEAAYEAASMVQSLGENGDDGLCEDIEKDITTRLKYEDEMQARRSEEKAAHEKSEG